MSEFNNLGAEEIEVADQSEELGVEEQEVADPTDDKNPTDSDFAEQRRAREEAERRAEEAERRLAQFEAEQNARKEVLGQYGYEDESSIYESIDEAHGFETGNVEAEIRNRIEIDNLKREKEALQNEVDEQRAENMLARTLAEVQALDPSIKDINDLGESFVNYIKAGLSPKESYYAVKSAELKEHITPPKAPGKAHSEPKEKEYYSEDEVVRMTSEERTKHAYRIFDSLPRWGKG